jgi:hypothetical protein
MKDGATDLALGRETRVLARRAADVSQTDELDGGDLSLMRWMLTLTPAERLRFAQGFASSAERLRRARRA